MICIALWLAVLTHWTVTGFGPLCSLVRGSDRFCLGFCGSRSRLPDAEAGEAQYSLLTAETCASWASEVGGVHKALTLSGGVSSSAGTWNGFFKGMPTWLQAFLKPLDECRLRFCTWFPQSKRSCGIVIRTWGAWQIILFK